MFEDDVSIRTIGEVERKPDRFNRFLRGDSRDRAMEAFFGNEVRPALGAFAAWNCHSIARNPDGYGFDDVFFLSSYELATRVSDGLCRKVAPAPATRPWRYGGWGCELGFALGSIVNGVSREDLDRRFSVDFMLGEIGKFEYGGRPTRGGKAISLIADAIHAAPDPDEMLSASREWSREEKMEYIRPLVVYSRLAYARMQCLRDMLNRNNFKKM